LAGPVGRRLATPPFEVLGLSPRQNQAVHDVATAHDIGIILSITWLFVREFGDFGRDLPPTQIQ
jgi:hypothetical protein